MPTKPFVLTPSPIYVLDELLGDLQNRLKSTRWPLDVGNDDWFGEMGTVLMSQITPVVQASWDFLFP